MSDPVSEVSESRRTEVGGMPVHRALPHHGRRTVGAWCFLDRFGPVDVAHQPTMTVGPHPHIGLHTVTWLVSGEVLHTDSLGSRQLIRPGQLNLMTAGGGVAHAEDARDRREGTLDGLQLWVAQPEATRHGTASFAHYDDLPVLDLGPGTATVLIGDLGGARSPAVIDSALFGAQIEAHGPLTLPLAVDFEYGIFVMDGTADVGGTAVTPNQFVYLGTGRDHLALECRPGSRLFLLGGEPFGADIEMWWNFVARTKDELEEASRAWEARSDRFGPVDSTLERIDAPRPFWLR
jgi:redox-sensitive bicupin YhaK (pirin superfamily)